jgi:formylglycine-generating enzyme required for sulfatase activity
MRLRATVNRADLLLVLREAGVHGVELAAACGFVPLPPKEDEKKTVPEVQKPSAPDKPEEPEIGEQAPPVVVPRRMEPLTFLVPVEREDKELPPERVAADLPPGISDAELALRDDAPLPLRPLVRWSRLGMFLRRVGGRMVPGVAVDQERLAREVARGLPLVAIPRVVRRVWARELLVLRDETSEMYPFLADGDWLMRRLRWERGKAGLRVKRVLGRPNPDLLAGVARDVPVLAISAMGQHHGGRATQAAWAVLGELAKRRGHAACALMPVPRRCCRDDLSAAWPMAVWDHGVRLPRDVRRRFMWPQQADGSLEAEVVSSVSGDEGVEHDDAREVLLNLVSPATFVGAPLLRAVRLRVQRADARSEWLAWHDPLHWLSPYSFGFLNPESLGEAEARYAERLKSRGKMPVEELVAIDELIARHHAPHSVAIAEEARLRAMLSRVQARDPAALVEVKKFFGDVLDRLRVLATSPESEEGRRSGLAAWFVRMAGRLPEPLLADPELADPEFSDLLARSLAVAHLSLGQQEAQLPRGMAEGAYGREWADAGQRRGESQAWRLDLLSDQESAKWSLVPALHGIMGSRSQDRSAEAPQPALLSLLVALSGGGVVVSRDGVGALEKVGVGDAGLEIPVTVPPGPMVIDTGKTRLTIEPRQRPRWAARMEYGRDGLSACIDAGRSLPPLHWKLSESAAQPTSRPAAATAGQGRTAKGLWVPAGELPWGRLSVDEFGPLATFAIRGVEFRLRWIAPGSFLMGSPEDEVGRYSNEGPRHEVRISRGFWMGDTPVTQAQWKAVVEAARESVPAVWNSLRKEHRMKEAPSRSRTSPDHPVDSVNWYQSDAFCLLLRALLPQGPAFRLPSEAQWEYACRAGSEGAFFDGSPCTEPQGRDLALDRLGWFDKNSEGGTHAVRQKPPNAWGLCDVHGNVWEWCRDAWDEDAYPNRAGGAVDPEVTGESSADRVVRGGSWDDEAWSCRAAIRYGINPDRVWIHNGLRLSAGQELEAAEPPGAGSGTLPAPPEPAGAGAERPGFFDRFFDKRRRK